MAVMSALSAGRTLPPEKFLVLIYITGWIDPRVILRLEELGHLEYPMTSSGIETGTIRLVRRIVGEQVPNSVTCRKQQGRDTHRCGRNGALVSCFSTQSPPTIMHLSHIFTSLNNPEPPLPVLTHNTNSYLAETGRWFKAVGSIAVFASSQRWS
jgi:hypothetical protein